MAVKELSDRIKNLASNIFKNNILKSSALLLLILFSGYALGRLIGINIVTGIIKGSRSALLFYRPPLKYIYTANLLSSESELKRLEGYYSLLDYKIIDMDLLIERYKKESILIKPTIIWLLGYSVNKDKVLKFLSEEYNNPDQRIKIEILRTMKRLDESFFTDFTGSHKIDIRGL